MVPDLGYGACRLVVAVPESWIDVTHMIDLVDLTSRVQGRRQDVPGLDQVPRLDPGLLSQMGHLLLPDDRLRRRARAAPEPGNRRHHRRPDELGDDPEGQPAPRDRRGHRTRLGLLPDRPRTQPVGPDRRRRNGSSGTPVRCDGRRPRIGGLAAHGSGRQPRRPGPRHGGDRGRLPPRSRGPAHLRGAKSGTIPANPAGESPP